MQDSSYKSLNKELIKSIQDMKTNLGIYKKEIVSLNEILLSERIKNNSNVLKIQEDIKCAFQVKISVIFKEMLDYITSFNTNCVENEGIDDVRVGILNF